MINLPAGGVISGWASEASLERTALRIAYLHALTQPEQARECGIHLYSHHLLIMPARAASYAFFPNHWCKLRLGLHSSPAEKDGLRCDLGLGHIARSCCRRTWLVREFHDDILRDGVAVDEEGDQ